MNNKIKSLIAIVFIIIAIIFFVLNKNTDTHSVRIGVATVLSGDFAAAGENMVRAAKLAVEDINMRGGINSRKVELVVVDSGVSGKDGLSAVQKLIDINNTHYIVGGMSSNGVLAVAPIINQKKVILMTPVTGGSGVDNAGEYVFRNANSDILAGRDIAKAMIKLGFKNIGTVTEVTEYTLDIKKTFEKVIKQQGGNIVVSEEFQSDTKDYRTLITKISSYKPEALLVLSQTGTNAAYFIKQSHELNFNPSIFTDFTFATNNTVKQIVGSLDGIYFADPSYADTDLQTKDFFDRYNKTYNISALIPFHAAASYDAVMIYADAINNVGDNPEKVKNWLLKNVKNRNGFMGSFSFDDKGNSDLGFTIKIIKNGKAEQVNF
jgi:branched-chain amino acid transport system substrate-binding protein